MRTTPEAHILCLLLTAELCLLRTFLLGLTINSYFIWIVSSYEKSTRDQAASAGGTGLEEKL